MDISLTRAELSDAQLIHSMQVNSFAPLLEKYQDFETNPANEPLVKVINRIEQQYSDYYIIRQDRVAIGGIRIIKMDNGRYRVSPIFILPEYQGNGIAQKVFNMIEHIYCDAKGWELDTILQEQRNCYLYEKLGYKQTGKTEIINSKMTLVFYEKCPDQQ